MAGRAFTILCGPASTPPGTVGDFIDDVPPGAVIVIDNGGREDATIWGDILTEIAHRRGIAGTVIDGINRDVHLCRALGYPVFSKDHWMRTGKDRVQVERTECAVNIGGARVAPGDLMRGDPDALPKKGKASVERAGPAACREGFRAPKACGTLHGKRRSPKPKIRSTADEGRNFWVKGAAARAFLSGGPSRTRPTVAGMPRVFVPSVPAISVQGLGPLEPWETVRETRNSASRCCGHRSQGDAPAAI